MVEGADGNRLGAVLAQKNLPARARVGRLRLSMRAAVRQAPVCAFIDNVILAVSWCE
jgi:hypothetical protein